jgi:hypothetical protein
MNAVLVMAMATIDITTTLPEAIAAGLRTTFARTRNNSDPHRDRPLALPFK